MRVEKLAAIGAAIAAFAAGGCGDERTDVRHVGEDNWVRLATPGYSLNNEFRAGDECVIVREAELILRNGGVIYNHGEEPEIDYGGPAGTECPNGTKLDLTQGEVKEQDTKYQAFVQRRREVTDQVEDMGTDVSGAMKHDSPTHEEWVDLVNPDPIASANVVRKYGDTCHTSGSTSARIGTLSTGESVMLLINPGAAGSLCPTGSIYVEPIKTPSGISDEAGLEAANV